MNKSFLTTLVVFSLVLAGSPSAQNAAVDPSDRLREVLPADVATRVLTRIALAREQELPGPALANRALKFAARGIPPADIERAIFEHADRLGEAKSAIQRGRAGRPADDEIEAGAEALRLGVSGVAVSELAKGAPSARSLAVPLFVIGGLVDRGLPSDQALQRVLERLQARASDNELEQLPAQVGDRGGGRPAQAKGQSKRPDVGTKGRGGSVGGGRPASVPANPPKGKPGSPGNQ